MYSTKNNSIGAIFEASCFTFLFSGIIGLNLVNGGFAVGVPGYSLYDGIEEPYWGSKGKV